MPTYQYACTACGHELEAVQSFTDDPLTDCPACQGRLRKLFGSVGVVFKGPGFYRTDSRAGSNGSSGANGANGSRGSSDDSGKGSTSSASDSGSSSPADSAASDKTASGKGGGDKSGGTGGSTTKTGAST